MPGEYSNGYTASLSADLAQQLIVDGSNMYRIAYARQGPVENGARAENASSIAQGTQQPFQHANTNNNHGTNPVYPRQNGQGGSQHSRTNGNSAQIKSNVTVSPTSQQTTNAVGIDVWRDQISKMIGLHELQGTHNLPPGATISSYLVVPDIEKNPVLATTTSFVPYGRTPFKLPDPPKHVRSKSKEQTKLQSTAANNPLSDPRSPAPSRGLNNKEFIDFIQSPRVLDVYDQEEDEEEAKKFWICDPEVYKNDMESRRLNGKQQQHTLAKDPFVPVTAPNSMTHHPINSSVISHPTSVIPGTQSVIKRIPPSVVVSSIQGKGTVIYKNMVYQSVPPSSSSTTSVKIGSYGVPVIQMPPRQTQPRVPVTKLTQVVVKTPKLPTGGDTGKTRAPEKPQHIQKQGSLEDDSMPTIISCYSLNPKSPDSAPNTSGDVPAGAIKSPGKTTLHIKINPNAKSPLARVISPHRIGKSGRSLKRPKNSSSYDEAIATTIARAKEIADSQGASSAVDVANLPKRSSSASPRVDSLRNSDVTNGKPRHRSTETNTGQKTQKKNARMTTIKSGALKLPNPSPSLESWFSSRQSTALGMQVVGNYPSPLIISKKPSQTPVITSTNATQQFSTKVVSKKDPKRVTTTTSKSGLKIIYSQTLEIPRSSYVVTNPAVSNPEQKTATGSLPLSDLRWSTTTTSSSKPSRAPPPYPFPPTVVQSSKSNYTVLLQPERSSSTDTASSSKPDLPNEPLDFSITAKPSTDDIPDEPLDYSMKTLRKLEEESRPQEKYEDVVLDLSVPKVRPVTNLPTNNAFAKQTPFMAAGTVYVPAPNIETPDLSNLQTLCSVALSSESYAKEPLSNTVKPSTKTGRKKQANKKRNEKRNKTTKKRAPKAQTVVKQSTATNTGPERSNVVLSDQRISSRKTEPEIGSYLEVTRKQPVQSLMFAMGQPQNKAETVITEGSTRKVAGMQNVANTQAPHEPVAREENLKYSAAVVETVDDVVEVRQKLSASIQKPRAEYVEQLDPKSDTFTEQNDEITATEIQKTPEVTPTVPQPPSAEEVLPTVEKSAEPKDIPEKVVIAARPNSEDMKLASKTSITEVTKEAGDGGMLSGLSMDKDEAKSEPRTTIAMELSQQAEQMEGLETKQRREMTENLYDEISTIASQGATSLDVTQSAESHIAIQDSGTSNEIQAEKMQSAIQPSISPKREGSTAAENEPKSVERSVVDGRDELLDVAPKQADDFKLVNDEHVQSDAITFDIAPKEVDDVKPMNENQVQGGRITSDATVLEENPPVLGSESTEEVHRMTAQKNALLDDISKGRNSPNVALCRLDSYEMRNNFSVVSNSEIISIRPESLKTIIKAKEESKIPSDIENVDEKEALETEMGDVLEGNTGSIQVIGLEGAKISDLPWNATAAKSTDTHNVSEAEGIEHDVFESENLEAGEKESHTTDKEDTASQETGLPGKKAQVTPEENTLSLKEKMSSEGKTESGTTITVVDSIKVTTRSHQQTQEKVSKGFQETEITTKEQQTQEDDVDENIEGAETDISDESDDLVAEMKTPEKVFVYQRRSSENQEFFEMNEACCDEYDNMYLTEDEGDNEDEKELHEKKTEILHDEKGKISTDDIIVKKEMNDEEELEKVIEKRHEGAIKNTQKEFTEKNGKGIPSEESNAKVQNDEENKSEVRAVVSKDFWKAPETPEKLKICESKEETTGNNSVMLPKDIDSKKELKTAGLVEDKEETKKVKSDGAPSKRIKRRSAPRVSLDALNNGPIPLKSPVLSKRFGYGSDFSTMKRKTPLKLGYNTHADLSGCDIKIKRRKLVKKDELPSPKTPKISPKSSALTYILLSDSSDSSDETEDMFKTSKSKKKIKKSKKTSLSPGTKTEPPQEKKSPEAAVMPIIKEEPIDNETSSSPRMEEETKENDTAPEATKGTGLDSPERVKRLDAADETMTPRSSRRKRKPPKFLEETIYHDVAYECVTTPSDTNDGIPESPVFISISPNLTEQENAPKSGSSGMALEASDKSHPDERSSEKHENTQLSPSHDTEKTIKISSVLQNNSSSLTKQKPEPRSSSLRRKNKRMTQSVAKLGVSNSTELLTQVKDDAEAVLATKRASRLTKKRKAPRLTFRKRTPQSLTPKMNRKGPLKTKNRRGRSRQLSKTVGEQRPGNGASKRKKVSTDTLRPAVVVPPVVTNEDTVPSYPQSIPIRLSSLKSKNTEIPSDNSSDDVFAKTVPRRLSYSQPTTTLQSIFSPVSEDSDIAAPPPNKIRLKSFVKDPYAPDSEDFGHITDASNGNALKKTGTDPFKMSFTGEKIQKPPKLKPKFQILNSSISKKAKKLSKKWKTFELISGIKVPNISPVIGSSNPDSISLKDVVDEILRTSPVKKPKPLIPHKSSTGILKKSSYTMVARTKVSSPRRVPRPSNTLMKSSMKKIHRQKKYQTARMKGNWKKAELHNVTKIATKPLPYHQPERLSKAERDENIYRTMQKLLNMGLIMDQMQRRGMPAPAWGSSFDFMKQKEVHSDETTCSSELRPTPMSAPSDFTPPPTFQRIPEVKNEFRWFTRKYIQLKPCFVVLEKLNTEKYCT